MKDIQTIWMSNAGLDLLNLSSKIKSADYDYADAVVTALTSPFLEHEKSGLITPEIDLAWNFL